MARQVVKFPSSDAVIQTVAWLRKNSFKPVPLHPQSKAAIFKTYVSSGYKPPGDELWRDNNYGVGIVTGPRSDGPVDIDCDCNEAIYFAARFLPPTTAVFGRKSKPRSHYLYKVDTPDFDKQAFIDPVRTADSTIVEARGDGGHQTVMPGSVHETSGEAIEWSDLAFPEVTSVTTAILSRAVRKVAIATLIVRHIWADGYHNEPAKHLAGMLFYLDWTADEAEDLINAVMDYTDDDDKSRLPTVRATYRRGEAGKKISGAGVLRKQLHNDVIVDRLLEWAGSPTINLLQEYNDRFACVLVGGKFRIASVDAGPGESPVFMMKDDFLNKMGTDYTTVEIDGKEKTIPKAALWLKSPRRRSYDNVDFRPGEEDDGKILNLWGGWAIRPDEGDDYDTRCEAYLDLVFDVICGGDEEMAFWLINWMANIVREPMKKSMTAPVIIGPEGAGKSLMVAYFGVILGPAYTVVTQDKHLTGSFNRHLAGTLLLHSEEALYGGDRKHASIIRSLITDEFRMAEPKGIDATRVRNFLRLIMLCNPNHLAAPVMPGDRRYTVIDMDQRKAPDDLIDKVVAEKDAGGPAALFRYLLEFDYDAKLARSNVKNKSLSDLKAQNLPPIDAWWMETLLSGLLLPDRLNWAQDSKKDWPRVVGSPALYAAMEVSLRNRGVRNIPNPAAFNQTLEKMIGRSIQRYQRDYSNELVGELGIPQSWTLLSNRQLSWIDFPPLDQCRKGFDKYVGQVINWPEQTESGTPARETNAPDF